jgi:hypothetical protein
MAIGVVGEAGSAGRQQLLIGVVRPGGGVAARLTVADTIIVVGIANEASLLKLIYADILKASERWTYPRQSWSVRLSQLMIQFPEIWMITSAYER